MPGPAVPPVKTGTPAKPSKRYTSMVIKACFGGKIKATKFTIKVCNAKGDMEKGSGMMIYALTQFIATNKAIFVKSLVVIPIILSG